MIGTTIGIRMPNVPQAVPIENERNADRQKITTGSSMALMPVLTTRCSMKTGVCRRSRHTPESVQARMRMMFAGSISFMPSTEPEANSAKLMSLRGTYMMSATISAPKEANTSEIEADELPMAAWKLWYFASAPQ